ncbi:MAG: DNA replication/repair protein RecF [Candidatus Saccharimonadales bacterium]
MITDIRLQNFRSYKDAAFELDGAVNIVVGPNASGKTNLLEALLVIATGKSYRGGSQELIRLNQPWARVEVHTIKGSRVVKLTQDETTAKTFDIDQQTYKRLPASQKLPVVLFEPQHLTILSGRPELRRNYLDDMLEQSQPEFASARRSYARALAQRNALLKKGPAQSAQHLFAWNIRLSELGGTIANTRRQLIDELNSQAAKIYQQLSTSRTAISLSYSSPLATENYVSSLLHNLEKNTAQDFARGFTSFGPHREDMIVTIGGNPAQEVASRGELRTIVLALKIMELKILQAATKTKPIILLDDVFSELDGARRQALTKYLKTYQTFITTTDADIITHNFAQKANVISLG